MEMFIKKKLCSMKYIISGAVLLMLLLFVFGHVGFQSLLRSFSYKCERKIKSRPVMNTICYVNFYDRRIHMNRKTVSKMIYFVTPTYPRPEQIPELTRLAHTLMHVPRIHWIVADDQPLCSDEVANILRRSGLPYTLISSPKPYTFQCARQPKGVANREAALAWVMNNRFEGVLYFGDDDNTVDLQLFDEIRNTKRISMFPVGLISGYGVSSPIIKDGKVIAFFDSWSAQRTFPVDMAGFAINTKLLSWSANMPYQAGGEENGFLVNLGVKLEDIEPLAQNCSKVLVWHTKTQQYHAPKLKIDQLDTSLAQNYQNIVKLLNEVYKLGIADPSDTNPETRLTIRNSSTYGALLSFTRN